MKIENDQRQKMTNISLGVNGPKEVNEKYSDLGKRTHLGDLVPLAQYEAPGAAPPLGLGLVNVVVVGEDSSFCALTTATTLGGHGRLVMGQHDLLQQNVVTWVLRTSTLHHGLQISR